MAVINSRTSPIVGPKAIIDPLIAGIKVNKDCSSLHDLPDITFTFDGTAYVLAPDDYVIRLISAVTLNSYIEYICTLGIHSIDSTEG